MWPSLDRGSFAEFEGCLRKRKLHNLHVRSWSTVKLSGNDGGAKHSFGSIVGRFNTWLKEKSQDAASFHLETNSIEKPLIVVVPKSPVPQVPRQSFLEILDRLLSAFGEASFPELKPFAQQTLQFESDNPRRPRLGFQRE